MPEAGRFEPGDVVYALPGHVCPTVALHREVLIAEGGRVTGKWVVVARDRMLSVYVAPFRRGASFHLACVPLASFQLANGTQASWKLAPRRNGDTYTDSI